MNSSDFFTGVYDMYAAVSRCVDAACRQHDKNLSYGQYVLLCYIFHQKDQRVTQKQLFAWSSVRKGTVSQHLGKLCELGYIEQQMFPNDHRCKEIALTPKAEQIVAQIEAELLARLNREMESHEQQSADELLKKIQVHFEKQEAI